MGWNGIHTWTVGERLTAANLNLYLNDNTLDLDRRTSPVDGETLAIQTTTSTTYTDLATVGPAVTVTVGSTGKVLLGISCALRNSSGNFSMMAFAMSGATVWAGDDSMSLQTSAADDLRAGATWIRSGLATGSTTFTAKYRVTAGTGTFTHRRMWVTPLGS